MTRSRPTLPDHAPDETAAGRVAFWRRTPPALFPACLGALSLGLAWRGAGAAMDAPGWIGELLLVVFGTVFTGIFLAFLAKIARRPAVLLQDLTPKPMRAAASAGSMGLMLLAAAILPWAEAAARWVWWAGLALHAACAVAVLAIMIGEWREGGWRELPLGPVLFLPLVGQVVAPPAGIALGYPQLSLALLYGSLLPAVAIAVAALARFLSGAPLPPPARPAQAIYLATTAIIARDAALLDHQALFLGLFVLALVTLVLLLLKLRWLTEGGWTPSWGAFTFPLGACAGLCLTAEKLLPGLGAGWIGMAVLIPATAVIPWILGRSLAAWASGRLAAVTGAAIA
ncbi:MAG: tellurium resistance protein [Alphaproteobacteria bacterium]|nr:MAG: tellurium resistance protein [Alphaproteobacteria bacterium]